MEGVEREQNTCRRTRKHSINTFTFLSGFKGLLHTNVKTSVNESLIKALQSGVIALQKVVLFLLQSIRALVSKRQPTRLNPKGHLGGGRGGRWV